MLNLFSSAVLFILIFCPHSLFAQFYNIDEGYLTEHFFGDYIDNSLTFSAPFLRKPVDAKSGGLGNVGIASTPDANAMFFNASKIAFSDSKFEMAVNLAPMQIGLDDPYLTSFVAFKKFSDRNALGAEVKHSSSGVLSSQPPMGSFLGKNIARESLFSLAYIRKWANNFSSALTGSYIYSNITFSSAHNEEMIATPGTAFAADLSFTFMKPIVIRDLSSKITLGLAITNIGSQISYSRGAKKEYLPANIGLGIGWDVKFNRSNSLSFLADINKLLVPTSNDFPNSCQGLHCSPDLKNSAIKAAWRSFSDAGGGFSEEWAEVYYSLGVEYDYNERLFLRTGYLYDHPVKGNRSTLALGIGYRYRNVITNISYQIPFIEKEIKDNRFRFSVTYVWMKTHDSQGLKSQ